MKRALPALIVGVLLSHPGFAQEILALGAEDLQRMAIVFATVGAVDDQQGQRLPGVVTYPPNAMTAVITPYAGVLENWRLAPGATVAAGDVLADVNSPDVLMLQRDWLAARADLRQMEQALTRDRQLFDQGVIARQRLETAEIQRDLAQIAVDAAASALAVAGWRAADLTRLEAGSGELGRYPLRSSVAGVLTHRMVAVGERVDAFASVGAVQSDDRPWLSVMVPARLSDGLQIGQSLTLADDGTPLTVRHFDLEVDEATQTVEVLAEFEDARAYRPGQVVSVVVPLVRDGVMVPGAAVVHTGNDTTVYVRHPQGIEARTVALIPAGNGYVAAAGLAPGEQVVVQGTAVLKGIQLGLGSDE